MTYEPSDAGSSAESEAIIAVLKEIISDDLNVGVPIDEIDPDASLEHDLKIDSVAMVELIAAIESRFEFSFQDSDLVASSFANLGALAGIIAKRVAAKS